MGVRITTQQVSTLRSAVLVACWRSWRRAWRDAPRGSQVERTAAAVVAVIEAELHGRGFVGGETQAVDAAS